MPTSSLTVCVNGLKGPNRCEICVKSHSKMKRSTELVFGVYIPWYAQIDGRMVCKHTSTRETVVFNTYGTAGESAGTWRGAYGHQVPASGDGASMGLWNICLRS